MLCVCVTAIEGVGLTTPVGVVVDATDVAGLIMEIQVVWVVVDTVVASCSDLWLDENDGGKGGRGCKK